MRRHLICGRFGNDDFDSPPLEKGEVETRLDFLGKNNQLNFGIGEALTNVGKLGLKPSEVGLDFLILASHVYAADTRIFRVSESQDGWTREIRMNVPVSDPSRWSKAIPILVKMLKFLTGDIWSISFRHRKSAISTDEVGINHLFDELALFSGGLDSLIGAIDLLEDGKNPLFVSHASEGAASDSQRKLFHALQENYEDRYFNRIRLWMTFPKKLVLNSNSENTTRGRSFLFFALGVFAGIGLGKSFTLKAPENGLIALNVPLDSLRLGALSTRTTHPYYMARWNQLLDSLEISGRVLNPYWDRTKGEMVSQCSHPELLKKIAPDSMSCSAPTKLRYRGIGTQHCGYCLPCLIRRASLEAGIGIGVDPTIYSLNLSKAPLSSEKSHGQQIRSFQVAIERIHKRPELAPILIHKPGPLSDLTEIEQQDLARVYRQGLEEVANILINVRTVSK